MLCSCVGSDSNPFLYMWRLLNSVGGIHYSRGTSVCSDVAFSQCAWQLWANERLKLGACISAYALCVYMKGTHTVSGRQTVRNNVNIQLHECLSFCFRLCKTGWESWKTLQSAFKVKPHLIWVVFLFQKWETITWRRPTPRQTVHVSHWQDRGMWVWNRARWVAFEYQKGYILW